MRNFNDENMIGVSTRLLDESPPPHHEEGETLEMRFIGRGGQGVVSAAQLLAEAAVQEGRFVQAFPDFGAERAGAPISAYARLSDAEIEVHSLIRNPGVVVVLDGSLSRTRGVASGLHPGGVLLCNYDGPLTEMRRLHDLPGGARLFVLPATEISLRIMGKDIPNTPMLGALVKVTAAVRMGSLQSTLERRFEGELREKNEAALNLGYEGVLGPG